ncbi:MAG TPA: DUF3048 domain-containing protein [Candidatus Saccharimonas sp.]|nr:DUF3048 domain-containing protein [Candidatus Saccharimonas sp.]
MNDIMPPSRRPAAPSVPANPEPPTPAAASAPTPSSTAHTSRQPGSWRRHWPALAVIGGLLLAGGGVYAWTLLAPQPEPRAIVVGHATPTPTPTPTPLKKASPLTGELVDPALANQPIISVIVENSTDARPQSGLSSAGVVYEALAEGGITRFQTFFLDNLPPSLGPVRSLRPYFVDWAMEFLAPVAHAGGSQTALDLAVQVGLHNLNALVIGAPTFFRTTDRPAPHNLYTTGSLLTKLLAARHLNQPATFTVSPRKPDSPPATGTTAPNPKITIDYSGAAYKASYSYNPDTNDYTRSVGGALHIDRNTGQAIHVKNIVVEYMPTSSSDGLHLLMITIGSGKAIVFRDGTAVTGTWVKDSRTSRTRLLDASGADIPLDVGNTWYSIVPVGRPVTY